MTTCSLKVSFACSSLVEQFKYLNRCFSGTFGGLTLVLVQGSQDLHGAQRLHTQSTAGGSGSSTPLK